jgi:hypothetical protein
MSRGRWRGVSQLLAVIITLAIILAAGAFVFAWMIGLIRVQTTIPDIEVNSIILRIDEGENTAYLTVNLKNTGNVRIDGAYVYGYDDNGKKFTLAVSPIDPGKSAGNSLTIPLGQSNIVLDASGNNLHGTLYGGSWSSDSQFGTVLYFDGSNDYIYVDRSSLLNDVALHYTVQSWVRRLVDGDYWTGVVGKPGRNYNFWLGQSNSGGNIGGQSVRLKSSI